MKVRIPDLFMIGLQLCGGRERNIHRRPIQRGDLVRQVQHIVCLQLAFRDATGRVQSTLEDLFRGLLPYKKETKAANVGS